MTESVKAKSGIVVEDEISVPEMVALTPTEVLAEIAPEMVAVNPVGDIVSPADGFNDQATVTVPVPRGSAPTEKLRGTFEYCSMERGVFNVTVGLYANVRRVLEL